MADNLAHHMQAIDDYVTSTLMEIENSPEGWQLDAPAVLGRMLAHQQVLARSIMAIADWLDAPRSERYPDRGDNDD